MLELTLIIVRLTLDTVTPMEVTYESPEDFYFFFVCSYYYCASSASEKRNVSEVGICSGG